jgi:hypothetical protein
LARKQAAKGGARTQDASSRARLARRATHVACSASTSDRDSEQNDVKRVDEFDETKAMFQMGVSQTRLGELRNRAVEAMRFAPSWLKQIQMPTGTSAGNVLPVVGSFEELYKVAQIASLHNSATDQIEAFFAGREEVKVLELSSCEQRAIVTTNHKNKSHTISLRGTKNMKNVAQNLQLGTRPTGRAEDLEVPMHRGYRRIAQRCFEAFEPLIQDGYEIQFTGHSLGGAVAVALALLYHKKGVKVKRVVTFGAPKLGPKETAEASEELDILRVVQKDDIIPLLPMSRPFVRRPYCHLGEGILLDNDNPGVFADLPREWGAAGILWRQRMSIESVIGVAGVTSASANGAKTRYSNPLQGAAKRARSSVMAVFSMPTNESELEAEVKDLIASSSEESSASFALIQEEFNASSAISSSESFDENDESTTMRVGPTIFERLWALRQYSREEQIRRLDSHRMYRYVEMIQRTIDAKPSRVPLAEIYEPSEGTKQQTATPIPQLSNKILTIRTR